MVNTKPVTKTVTAISVDKEFLRIVDEVRGIVPRSAFFTLLMNIALEKLEQDVKDGKVTNGQLRELADKMHDKISYHRKRLTTDQKRQIKRELKKENVSATNTHKETSRGKRG